MRKRILAFTLSMAMMLGLAWQSAYAVDSNESGNPADHWFHDQLSDGAKAIYDVIEKANEDGILKTGTQGISLDGVIGDGAAAAYLRGNRSLFNDFSAAKDAFDLEHPEAWYFDSSELSLTVGGSATSATASIGIGKSDSYYVLGVNNAEDVTAKTAALEAQVEAIVNTARNRGSTYEKIKYVHDEVVNSISYKYETECRKGNEGFIRTAYALITHEGVCEGYARSFQLILQKLDIPCVLIHGTQMSGSPEAHMWCAVYIVDEKGTGWYVVDPTWDDPVVLSDAGAASDDAVRPGTDGGERHDYFMVGNDVIAANWIPSGYVSTGAMEFQYPDISPRSYGAGKIESNGLVVTCDDGLMEGTASTVYRISYNGDGLVAASRKGYYFLVKMYDINADGSADAIDQWYYPLHMLLGMGPSYEGYDRENLVGHGNKFYHDEPGYLVEVVSNCEYVEFGVTDVAPPAWEKPEDLVATKDEGYYKGAEDHIIAQTGLIYNPNGGYEQPPYVKNVSPAQNVSSYVGATHTVHMEFTDPLFHPDAASIAVSEALGKVNEAKTAMAEPVGVDYTGMNYSWGVNSGLPHQFAVKPEPENVRWYCTTHDAVHTDMAEIARYGSACRLTTLEFEFTPSVMWADDSVFYQFYLTGLVGAKSNKKPSQTGMAFVFENASMVCTFRCARNGGIDWNLWGQPQLLDDPNDLDFSKMVVEGVDGAQEKIADLYKNMNLDDYDMNGRLLLVVEDAGADKAKADTMSDLLESKGVDLQKAVASALYEIDFARVCSKTVVETGQSLRMQVGFPAGFDAGKLNQTVFKVYHFQKDKDGNITGVEEIPVTVTPYGLVFQVRSFSPFAIVAEKGTPDTSRSALLAVEGPGKVEIVGYEAGKMEVDGTVKLAKGETYTIRVIPDSGYVVDGITATGLTADHTIAYDAKDNTFILHYDDIGGSNAIIGISLAAGNSGTVGSVKVSSLCSHENVKSTGGKPATCTENGYGPTVTCADCGQTISDGEIVMATGHVYEAGKNYKEPTCTQPGTELTCTVPGCGHKSQAGALGHEYFEGVCVRDGAAEKCTAVFDPGGGKLVSGNGTFTVDANSTLLKESWPRAEKSGFVFSGWYTARLREDGDKIDSDLTVTRSIVLYAAWDEAEDETCAITVTASPSYGGSVSGGGNYKKGGTVTLTATPASGYSFSYWSEDGSNLSRSGTYSFKAVTDRTLVAVFTRGGASASTDDPGGTGTGSGTTTRTETAGDGTVTTTVTDSKAGSSTVTVTSPDGSVSVTETDASGNVSRHESFADGVEVSSKISVNGSVSANVSIPADMASASVTIRAPVTAGTVAVNSATGEVVMLSVPVDGGLKVVLDSSADIVLVDLSKEFDDMPGGHWAADSVAFVTAHGLFNGTGDGMFSPDAHMTRAMLMTVLARFNGIDTDSGATWYGPGMEWAVANGISDGTNPDADITREQLAVMLYRYAGSPGIAGGMSEYPDTGEISDWASQAMRWAVCSGIIQGSNGYLNPGSKALRSEVSAMIERFCRNVAAV